MCTVKYVYIIDAHMLIHGIRGNAKLYAGGGLRRSKRGRRFVVFKDILDKAHQMVVLASSSDLPCTARQITHESSGVRSTLSVLI